MSLEQIAPTEPIENTSVDPAVTPEIAEPENTDGEPRPELTPAEREARALKRRVDRLTREKYQLRAQVEQSQRPSEQPQTDPQDVHRQARELVEMERFNAKCNEIDAAGRKSFPDFKEKIMALQEEAPLFAENSKATPLMEAILDSDNPAALIHHLGSNPDLAAELADLSPRQQVRKLALIERDMGSKPAPKPSNAPKPLQPVKPTAAASGPDPSKDPEGWVAWRNAQLKSR